MPREEISGKMYALAQKRLNDHGLKQYEISAFALPGKESRHNLGYWKARPFLGLGPSAFSYWEGKRFQNIPHIGRYARALNNKQSAIDFSENLSDRERIRELFFVHLRLKEGVPIESFQKQHKRQMHALSYICMIA